MVKTVIFGAGNLGSVLAKELEADHEVIGFIDNNGSLQGKKVAGFSVLGGTEKILELDYDEIVIASTMRFNEIRSELMRVGVSEDKFNHEIQNRLLVEVQARVNFLKDFANEYRGVDKAVSVAEGGVFQGMFAAEINRHFPERKLYLFDTFEGFHARDVETESREGFSSVVEGYYNETSVEAVMNKMPFPEVVEIRKGYFPETLQNMDAEKFLFVNLDFDLYTPTLEALKYFYPRMIKDGVILVHDYYTKYYYGIKKAIDNFEATNHLSFKRIPIGDGISIAIIPQEGKNDEKKLYRVRGETSG